MSTQRVVTENLTGCTENIGYDITYQDSIKGIDVLTADAGGGDVLVVMDIEGNTHYYPMVPFNAAGGAYTCFPFRLMMRIRQIVGDGAGNVGDGATGTNLALDELVLLH